MGLIVKKTFPNAALVIDRFHVQKLALDALQEIRIKHRWEAIDAENDTIENAKYKNLKYSPKLLLNGDTLIPLLARSRYLLYNPVVNELKINLKERLYFLKNIQI
jgi:transposase